MMRSISSGGAMLRPWMFVCCVLICPHAAQAVLGAAADTVQADRLRFKGAHSESTTGQMTTHEIRLQDGSSVKEYVNAAGVVFAVSWRTRLKPDLEALLGAQFAVHAAKVTPASGVARSKTRQSIREPNLVVHQAGRMNAFAGLAYVPTLVPEGIDAETLR
jgi:hypothetical protein